MWKNEKCRDKFEIDLNVENGVYVFSCMSGTGKTYLKRLLTTLTNIGEPVITYSYDDYTRKNDLRSYIRDEYKVIMLDRCDMYKRAVEECRDTIKEVGKSSIVLIDCKGMLNIAADRCYLTFSKDKVDRLEVK